MPELNDLPGGLARAGLYDLHRQELEAAVLSWAKTAVMEGDAVNRADPSYDEVDATMAYMMGLPASPITDMRLGKDTANVRKVDLNFIKRVIRRHASALTDIKPMFQWKTKHPELKEGASLLNQYSIIWWINTFADVELTKAAKWALTGGAGDIVVEYDPYFHGGDTRISARDWRNTLPIRPGAHPQSIQDWEGVIIRESHPLNQLLARYPEKERFIKADSGALPVMNNPANVLTLAGKLRQPPRTLSGRGSKDPNRQRADKVVVPQCTLYRMFLKDRSVNQNVDDMIVGQLGSTWAYRVRPGKALYPNGRLVLFTEYGILYDGPNPYWHGMFPITRLALDPWPWLFVGLGLIHELRATNDAINMTVNDMLRNLAKKISPPTRYDRNVPAGFRKRHDPRAPGQKILRPSNFQAGVEFEQVEDLPAWAMPFLERLTTTFHELSGVANLEQLLALRQAPGRDTLDKFIEALTPELRLEGRQMEITLRDVAHMVRSNFFQFQSTARTFSLLGDSAAIVKDLDYDPDTHIPAFDPSSPEAAKIPHLSADRPLGERAQYFSRQFSFFVSPSSLISMHATERKMQLLQLSRQGMVDIWTLAEAFDIPNMGSPPMMLLPTRDPKQIKAAVDARQPPPMEVRIPDTIPERLMAQQQLGIGQSVNPAGRKATGQESPQMKQRSDGSTAVSESG